MIMTRRGLAGAAAAAGLLPRHGRAQAAVLKIGDLNGRTRAFNERVRPKTPNQWPNMVQAGCHAATPAGQAFRPAAEGGCALME